jgi:hypothetical protein
VQYGDRAGSPLLYFHGHPGSRLEARFLAAAAQRAQVHLLGRGPPGVEDVRLTGLGGECWTGRMTSWTWLATSASTDWPWSGSPAVALCSGVRLPDPAPASTY